MVRSTVAAGRAGLGWRGLVLLVVGVLAATLGPATPALAGLHKEFQAFADCPINNPEVVTCVRSETTSGEFKIGKKTVPVTKPVILQGGLKSESRELVPAADGNTLSKTSLPVPGGIIGIEVLGPLTEVNATAELAGTVEVNLGSSTEPTETILPFKVKLENPALGESCYVGSNSERILPHLTAGETHPPGGVAPIHGSQGTIVISGQGKIDTFNGVSLVENDFAVPGANGCAGALSLIVDEGVDLEVGLPAAAGENVAVLTGKVSATGARSVRADAALPELGRCVKQAGEKVGKHETLYHGGYNDAGCIEESIPHIGEWEWVPGAESKAFTTSSGATTLETVGGVKVKCAASSGSGEYTGPKSATANVTLSGCQTSRKKRARAPARRAAKCWRAAFRRSSASSRTSAKSGPTRSSSAGTCRTVPR